MLSFLAVLVGVLRRNRNDTQRLEREQELRRYAYEERLRIAREVHDVVGHSLSVINMQAGVALHVLEKRPDQVGPSLEAIRQTSKDALEELRGTLTVFRGAGPDDVRAPQPGLDRLDELVAGLRSAGRHVTVTVAGQPDGRLPPLPTAVDHAAYRIVQEALTNVARHAEGADASVRIGVDGRALIIEVADCSEARRPGPVVAGNGISGMQERARAVGGTLQVGPDAAGRFVVRAELPTVGEGG
nr:sensor histidine kinase [Microlunatus panaciterrae]